MRARDQLRTVRHAFETNRLRALLTLTGIVIGAGSIVMLASLMKGGEDALVRSSQQANESDMIEVYARRSPHKDRHKTTRPLSAYDSDALGKSPLLKGALVTSAPQKRTTAYRGKNEMPVTLFGAGVDAPSLYRLEVERGRGLLDDDLTLNRRTAIVGQEVWKKLFGDVKSEGSASLAHAEVRVNGTVFQVVGVLAHKPVMGGGNGTWMWDRRIIIPRTTFLSVLEPDKKRVRSVFVRLKDAGPLADRVTQIADIVESTLLRRHNGVKNFEREGDGGDDQEELILNIVKILLLCTGVVALFVGGTNIMNIMLVTVSERTKEIGIRLAVGAKRRHILLQFLLEAMALSLVGGLLGVAGGLGFAFGIARLLEKAVGYWQFFLEPWSIFLGLGLALLVGAAFGLLPAWRAARLDPVEALRSE